METIKQIDGEYNIQPKGAGIFDEMDKMPDISLKELYYILVHFTYQSRVKQL